MTGSRLEDYTTALLVALEAKSDDTGRHAKRVAEIALTIGRAMKLSQGMLFDLKFGSLLHDVGKICTPDAILKKPGRLDPEEITIMRKHPTQGADMLRALGFTPEISRVVAEHHERFDGAGYPNQLTGEKISLAARIFAVADTYDAITRPRCYRAGAAPAVALHEIAEWSGRQFDPEIVATFLQLHGRQQIPAAAF
jgi:cyclic di-GMP phosphodiesterase